MNNQKISESDKLSNEFEGVIKRALKSNVIMQLKSSEVKNFFDKKPDCGIHKIQYNNETNLKSIKSIVKTELRGKKEVLAVMRGNKKTTLDHLDSIWKVILKDTGSTSCAYYQSNKSDNSIYLFTH